MNDSLLESAEFYQRRYHNFSSRVIIPTFLLFLFLLFFAVFAKKEITLTASGTIEPSRILSQIQSTSNQAILVNHLAENKVVKKGEVLIEYQKDSESAQEDSLFKQVETLKAQKEQLNLLEESIKTGVSQFAQNDMFGYEQMFQDYLHQAETLRSGIHQQNASIAAQNEAANASQAELGWLIDETNHKLRDYQTLKTALQTNSGLASSNAGYSIYQAYQNQLTSETKEQLKKQVLAQVDSQIAQLESSLATYRVQYAGSGTQQAYTTSLASQLESLKAKQLSKIGQEAANLHQRILEAETNLKVQGGLVQKGRIEAKEEGILHLNPETAAAHLVPEGILHLNPETAAAHLVPEGILLAELYPLLTEKESIKISTYVTSKDVAKLKVGDFLRFTSAEDQAKPLVLSGKITNIHANATKTEQGNFFKVEAELPLKHQDLKRLRYGLEGRVVVRIGQKTYLHYYLDQFLMNQ